MNSARRLDINQRYAAEDVDGPKGTEALESVWVGKSWRRHF